MNNNVWKPFVIALIVVGALMGMFFMPHIKVGDKDLRRVNILSDVQKLDDEGNVVAEVNADKADGIEVAKFDSAAVKVQKPVYIDQQ